MCSFLYTSITERRKGKGKRVEGERLYAKERNAEYKDKRRKGICGCGKGAKEEYLMLLGEGGNRIKNLKESICEREGGVRRD